MNYLKAYTREPINNILYDPKLAYSMHLALKCGDEDYVELNHNSGVLFAKATENEDGSLNPMSIKNPRLFKTNGGAFGIIAKRVLGDGDEDATSKGKLLFFTTKDFLIYKEIGLVSEDLSGLEEATNASEVIEISDEVANRLKAKLLTPENIAVVYPKEVTVCSKEELESIKATLSYSDGTKEERSIDWNLDSVDFAKNGTYELKGKVHKTHFEFPVAFNRADPCIGRWNGKYYFISTNDADHEHTIYVREADTIEGLVTAEDHLILDAYTYEDIGGLLWAPEFHIINGKLYIFHAATPGEFFYEESHVMELRDGGSPIEAKDWSRPRRVVKADGSDLCEAGKVITLDMTVFEWDSVLYACWSQREFLPKDLGAWLYIAKLNPEKPWMLASDPVVLSKPDYGWGNNHTFVEEGPFALPVEDKLYLTFSAAAVDTSYVVSYLVAEHGADLLNPQNFRKNNYPILTSRSVEGEYGTGHNAYVVDEDGIIWNTYHARPGTEGVRSSGIRKVHLDIDGAPMLDVTEDLDVKEELRDVTMLLHLRGRS